jgi:ferredoxin/flavodoxin
MMNRRTFLIGSAALAAGMIFPQNGRVLGKQNAGRVKMKTGTPKKGAVVWYSQTGNTGRHGRLIARTWEKNGIKVTASDYRNMDPAVLAGMDIIIMGSPVYYYEVPENFRNWIAGMPRMDEIPVATYVTFGGEGGNQHNTACTLLELMAGKGAVPAGMDMFGNMSAFAPTWSTGNTERILRYSRLPDEGTYARVRRFADAVLGNVRAGNTAAASKRGDFRELIKGSFSIRGTKLFISDHHIDRKSCIGCGACVEKCPVGAVNLEAGRINTSRCIACFGCVNNCPSGAMKMKFMGKEVYGYLEFIRRNRIEIAEPEELKKL